MSELKYAYLEDLRADTVYPSFRKLAQWLRTFLLFISTLPWCGYALKFWFEGSTQKIAVITLIAIIFMLCVYYLCTYLMQLTLMLIDLADLQIDANLMHKK